MAVSLTGCCRKCGKTANWLSQDETDNQFAEPVCKLCGCSLKVVEVESVAPAGFVELTERMIRAGATNGHVGWNNRQVSSIRYPKNPVGAVHKLVSWIQVLHELFGVKAHQL